MFTINLNRSEHTHTHTSIMNWSLDLQIFETQLNLVHSPLEMKLRWMDRCRCSSTLFSLRNSCFVFFSTLFVAIVTFIRVVHNIMVKSLHNFIVANICSGRAHIIDQAKATVTYETHFKKWNEMALCTAFVSVWMSI